MNRNLKHWYALVACLGHGTSQWSLGSSGTQHVQSPSVQELSTWVQIQIAWHVLNSCLTCLTWVQDLHPHNSICILLYPIILPYLASILPTDKDKTDLKSQTHQHTCCDISSGWFCHLLYLGRTKRTTNKNTKKNKPTEINQTKQNKQTNQPPTNERTNERTKREQRVEGTNALQRTPLQWIGHLSDVALFYQRYLKK